jgi:hypothetical protein
MAHDVFISYSSQNKATADAVCAGLEAEGIRCWIAPRDIPPGSNYGKEINGALKDCAVLVLIFSRPAGESVWVMKEVERAITYRKPVVPFRIEDVQVGEDLEFYLAAYHWLDALSEPLSKHIAKLAHSVLAFLGPEAAVKAGERRALLRPAAVPVEAEVPLRTVEIPKVERVETKKVMVSSGTVVVSREEAGPGYWGATLAFTLACALPAWTVLMLFFDLDTMFAAVLGGMAGLCLIGAGMFRWAVRRWRGSEAARKVGQLLAAGLSGVPTFWTWFMLTGVTEDFFSEAKASLYFYAIGSLVTFPVAMFAAVRWVGAQFHGPSEVAARRRVAWLNWVLFSYMPLAIGAVALFMKLYTRDTVGYGWALGVTVLVWVGLARGTWKRSPSE